MTTRPSLNRVDAAKPFGFVTGVEAPADDWGETIHSGSPSPKMIRRNLRMVAAADDTKINDTLSAAVFAFSRLEAGERAALYAEIEQKIGEAK